MEFSRGPADGLKVTLVGKGVCYDTGGLDIKPSSAMALMKKDMGGAAVALALAEMLLSVDLPLRLRVILPIVENSVSAASFRTGDVYKSRKGLTVEIGNTDAEGRLILADALALASEDEPDLLFDFATLTGAARVALGPEIPPFYTRSDALAEEIARAGAAANDPVWRLPLWQGYQSGLDSKIADVSSTTSHGFAGSITAALFLGRFVAKPERWAHFDVYCWNPSTKPGRPEGGEIQAARLLYDLIEARLAAGSASAMTQNFDRRLTPARPDLAAKHLEGRVVAARFVEGVVMQVKEGVVDVKREPRPDAPLETQAIYGDCVTVYDDEEGWCWGQLASDGYVGWIAANALWSRVDPPTHVVRVARSFVYPAANMKAPAILALPLGAAVRVIERRDDFLATSEGGFLYAKHLLADRRPRQRFRRCRRDADRRSLSLGRQESARDRLLGPRAMRAGAGRDRGAARQRFAAGGARASRRAGRAVAARRSRVLERPCRNHARRLDAASRQCDAYAGRVGAFRGGARAQSRRGGRRRDGDQEAPSWSGTKERMTLYLEDLSVGQVFRSEPRVVTSRGDDNFRARQRSAIFPRR